MADEAEGIPEAYLAGQIDLKYLEFGEEIGKGSFGSVYRGTYVGTSVAIKKIKQQQDVEEDLRIYVDREYAMTKFSHPHLVQFIGCAKQDNYVLLVTEYVPGGDLRSYLKDPSAEMNWKLRVQVSLDVAKGMAFLHSKGIMHRDLKSKNLLVDHNWKIKLCDFGFARSFARKEKRPYSICGTEDWMAPELILGLDYDEKVDIFSYGIVLAEIITRKKATTDLQRKVEEAFSFDEANFKTMVPKDCPPELVRLTVACCNDDADKRPDAMEVIQQLTLIEKDLTPKAVAAAAKPVPVPEIVDPSKRPLQKSEGSTPDSPSGFKRRIAAPAGSGGSALMSSSGPNSHFYGGGVPQRLLGVSDDSSRPRSPSGAGRRNPSVRTTDISVMKTVSYDGAPEVLYDALLETFGPQNMKGWVLLGYTKGGSITFLGSGVNVPDLVAKLRDDDIQYALIRLPVAEAKGATKSRDILLQWIGADTPIVQRGRKRSHIGDMKALLQPFHAELQAVRKDHISDEVILDKSGPLSGSHVID